MCCFVLFCFSPGFCFLFKKAKAKRQLDLLSVLPCLRIAGYHKQGFLACSLEFSKVRDFMETGSRVCMKTLAGENKSSSDH